MSSRLSVMQSQMKLAEKLTILTDRGRGLLARLYNIKKACQDPNSRPAFLSEKLLEPCIKAIEKKFPLSEKSQSVLQPVEQRKADILKVLSVYYTTFRDILEYKDHVLNLFTVIASVHVTFDIMKNAQPPGIFKTTNFDMTRNYGDLIMAFTTNFDMTRNYLDLIVTFVSMLLLLARVEDRKAMLGLYNHAYELAHQRSESSFARLGKMIGDFQSPMKKLAEEFIPFESCISSALFSLLHLYPRRNSTAAQWRAQEMLSLVTKPTVLLNPAQSETMRCEYLPLETIERWIIIGYMVCPTLLQSNERNHGLWRPALQNSYCITLFRDEVLMFHKYIEVFFDSIKGFSKRVAEVKESSNIALQNAVGLHRERRKYLRSALLELILILSDQPGLLGPKALYVLMGFSFARDEILWLIRHAEHPHPKMKKGTDLDDPQLPELLFYMEELRALVKKYYQVLQQYYVQYLNGYDAIVLNNLVKNLPLCPEDESIILSSFVQQMESLNLKEIQAGQVPDFTGFRLDWFRLQALTSISKATLVLHENGELARTLNTIVFHTMMVDSVDQLLFETSDLSIFCHHSRLFEGAFERSLSHPTQARFSIAFPLICTHFINCTHDVCPEEKYHIGERSLSVTNAFLDRLAKEIKDIVTKICSEQCNLSDQLLPKNAVPALVKMEITKLKDKEQQKILKELPAEVTPGMESIRKTRESLTGMDKLHMLLTELSTAINHSNKIVVWEHVFSPKEYLLQHLEARFSKALVGMMMYNPNTNEIAKPTELITSVKTYMHVLQGIENYVHVDIPRVFNNVLLQQTQQTDSHGEKTMTMLYTNWYLEVFLRRVTSSQICYSPFQKAFLTLHPDPQLPFAAEEYTDISELRALAELIGAYGMKFLHESLMWHIASQIGELKKLVLENKDILMKLRVSFDRPDMMLQLSNQLRFENLLTRLNIIGVILAFSALTQEALTDVISQRVPFLFASIVDFREHVKAGGQDAVVVDVLSSSIGLPCNVDPALVNALRAEREIVPDKDYETCCLLMVFIAVSLRTLVRNEATIYSPTHEAHPNNCHCYAKAINAMAGALFSLHGKEDVEERLQEFLALASSSLLTLTQETDKQVPAKAKDSVYLLLDHIVKESPFLTQDLLESCFPYALLRNSFHTVLKKDVPTKH